MKLTSILLFMFFSINSVYAYDYDILSGDKRTACEVLLCMSSKKRFSVEECNKPIRKYFSIKKYHHGSFSLSRTIKARKDFLKLCPSSNNDKKMESLVDAISNLKDENLCKAQELNKTIEKRNDQYRTTIKMPSYCEVLFNHEYTDLKLPKYTCDKKFYNATDWQRGYIIIQKGFRQIREPIKKDCWVDDLTY